MKKLHSLLIGINNYQNNIRALNGCEADVERMAQFLSKFSKEGQAKPVQLLSQEATKANIVKAFEEMIDKAQEGDICLFYYSGHGALEVANKVFLVYDANKALEVLVCHDANIEESTGFLADKELRYLIHQLALKKVEIVTIFDCCHSGDNTRNIREDDDIVERMTNPDDYHSYIKERDWKEFIFHDKVLKLDFYKKTLHQVLPQGKHIQLAACQSHEAALESTYRKSGFFTTALLEVLEKTGGDVSYYELVRRVRAELKKKLNKRQQHPIIYAPIGFPDLIYNQFLDTTIKKQPQKYTARFARTKHRRGKWMVDVGGIHGLTPGSKGDSQLILHLPDGQCTAYATKVGTTESEIKLSAYADVSPRENYPVSIAGLMAGHVNILITGDAEPKQSLEDAYLAQKEELAAANIQLVDQEAQADFVIRAFDGQYILTLPNKPYEPLIEQINGYSDKNSGIMISRLKKVSRWQFVRTLKNEYSHLQPEPPIKVEFIQKVNGQEVIYTDLSIEMAWNAGKVDGLPRGQFKIRFTNLSRQDLYVGCLYLDNQFMISPSIQKVVKLSPNEPFFGFDNLPLEVGLMPYHEYFKWSHARLHFTVMVSRRPFDTNDFYQEGFKSPVLPTRGERNIASKDLINLSTVRTKIDTWTAQQYEVRFKTPFA